MLPGFSQNFQITYTLSFTSVSELTPKKSAPFSSVEYWKHPLKLSLFLPREAETFICQWCLNVSPLPWTRHFFYTVDGLNCVFLPKKTQILLLLDIKNIHQLPLWNVYKIILLKQNLSVLFDWTCGSSWLFIYTEYKQETNHLHTSFFEVCIKSANYE